MRGTRRHPLRRLAIAALLLSLLLLALPATALAAPGQPTSYIIEGVPFYQQIQATGCGSGATQMVLDYWGPFIDQKSVYDAARTSNEGTAVPDVARAGQFSSLSFSAGDRFPANDGWGYPGRALGYAGFYHASTTPWLTQLKAVVAQGYPVICLTDWLPGVYGPHYRVMVGYDDAKGVVILNDPWAREFKSDNGYQGSASQKAAYDRHGVFVGWEWSYADFLAVWKLSTSDWGIAGSNYGAALIAPWKVALAAPAKVAAGKSFRASVTVTYPCPAPFATAGYPTFPATDVKLQLSLPAGFSVSGGSGTVSLGAMTAGQTKTACVTLVAGNTTGSASVGATASGLVSGSLDAWYGFPAYSYTDLIGGSGTAALNVTE